MIVKSATCVERMRGGGGEREYLRDKCDHCTVRPLLEPMSASGSSGKTGWDNAVKSTVGGRAMIECVCYLFLPVLHLHVGQPLLSMTFPNGHQIAQTGPQNGRSRLPILKPLAEKITD